LPCKRIFFIKWVPVTDEAILRQSLIDLVWAIIQNVMAHNFTSLAFPAIGCGKHNCSVDIVVKTLVKEMRNQLTIRSLPFQVRFIIQPNAQHIYDEFCKQLVGKPTSNFSEKKNTCMNSSSFFVVDTIQHTKYELPSTWEKANENKIFFQLSNTSEEYKTIAVRFNQAMTGKYTSIIQIERIQNERWYIQYLAHSHNFKERLNEDTEKSLFHGCPEQAARLISEDCFNRSFAGVNGKSLPTRLVLFLSTITLLSLCRSSIWCWSVFFIGCKI